MIPAAVHRSPGSYLTAEETPENLWEESVDEACGTSYRLKWGHFPSNEIGRIAKYVRKELNNE
jgi:hypothetical protein